METENTAVAFVHPVSILRSVKRIKYWIKVFGAVMVSDLTIHIFTPIIFVNKTHYHLDT